MKGYILKIRPDRLDAFLERIDSPYGFSEPVDPRGLSVGSLICFISTHKGIVTHIARGRKSINAGSGLRRLQVTRILPLKNAITSRRIKSAMNGRIIPSLQTKLLTGGVLSSRDLQAIFFAAKRFNPGLGDAIDQLIRDDQEGVDALPESLIRLIANEQDAVTTALSIAGIDKDQIAAWELPANAPPSSYLDGLPSVRMREDAMIVNDLNHFPEHELVRSADITQSVVFRNETSILTVTIANRTPLEEMLGTDLIYYNETLKSFVMVQYKAMEEEDDRQIFRLPQGQLDEEVARMDQKVVQLRGCPVIKTPEGFRFSDNPFFLKFCPRKVFNPRETNLVQGKYIPLEYWHLAKNSASLMGPRGGYRIVYEEMERYLTNTEFIELVAKAWVGTTPPQSEMLRELIRESIAMGKSVVLAVKSQNVDS